MADKKKQPRKIRLTNTLTGKKEELQTQVPGRLTFYSCGPTVYNFIHIGNLRGGLVADLFYKYFLRAGYDVVFVRNYTDVDDKIITRGHEERVSAAEIAEKYIAEVEKDYAVAGMEVPSHTPRVTTHIQEIIDLIQGLISQNKAYLLEDGEVIFSIDSFPSYGKLSHKKMEDLISGIRVEVNAKKRNPLDFTLWKPAKPGEPFWESPWGKGRPGWHIECSAMARKWCGEQIDVHHGGEDLIFPHHENEIAQSEGATGVSPFVRFWVHHAFVTLSNEKMSKSLGNVLTAREFLTRFSGEVARYMLLSSHYRSIIDFGPDAVEQSLSALHRIYEAKAKALELKSQSKKGSDLKAESVWGSFIASCEAARKEIDENFANDLNTPGALGVLFTLIREFNRTLSEPFSLATPASILGASQFIEIIENEIGGILGIGRLEPKAALSDLNRIRASLTETKAPDETEIKAAIEERAQARRMKDFAKADSIRKDLENRGILIHDGPKGTTWSFK